MLNTVNNSLLLMYVKQTIVEQKNGFLGREKGHYMGRLIYSTLFSIGYLISWYEVLPSPGNA